MVKYRELQDTKYLRWQRDLLKGNDEGRTERQREVLLALLEPERFYRMVCGRVGETEGRSLPVVDGPLTEASFREPTADQEERMFAAWSDVPPVVASKVSFWGAVTLNHLREGKIRSATWLAADGTGTTNGAERVERALSGVEDGGGAAIDRCVRTVFRTMSGLPISRGNRSVFVNPSFGRGWWREWVVRRVTGGRTDSLEPAAIRTVLRRNKEYWEKLVTLIVSRGSVFGSLAVQSSLIQCLAVRFRDDPSTMFRATTELTRLVRQFSRLSAAREFGILSAVEIRDELNGLMDLMESERSTAVQVGGVVRERAFGRVPGVAVREPPRTSRLDGGLGASTSQNAGERRACRSVLRARVDKGVGGVFAHFRQPSSSVVASTAAAFALPGTSLWDSLPPRLPWPG